MRVYPERDYSDLDEDERKFSRWKETKKRLLKGDLIYCSMDSKGQFLLPEALDIRGLTWRKQKWKASKALMSKIPLLLSSISLSLSISLALSKKMKYNASFLSAFMRRHHEGKKFDPHSANEDVVKSDENCKTL